MTTTSRRLLLAVALLLLSMAGGATTEASAQTTGHGKPQRTTRTRFISYAAPRAQPLTACE
jgi:hypothetical protein